MARIILEDVSKTYPGAEEPAIENCNLTIERGEIATLLGPSGCGKTTALRLIAGFETPDTGKISFDGRIMVGAGKWVPPEKRNVGMVFQDYALFPHLDAEKNIGFGLPSGREAKNKVKETIELVGLSGYESRFPHQLSGGQQQRVALARALARKPLVVLLDEPFSNLDADFRTRMRREVAGIIKKARATAVFVTHDQTEALTISDRIAVLNNGRIEQIDTPEQIYRYPDTEFVATFVGQSNLLPGIISEEGQRIDTAIGSIPCEHTHGRPPGSRVVCSIRPNSLNINPHGAFTARLTETVFSGSIIEATGEVALSNGEQWKLLFHLHPEEDLSVGDLVHFDILPRFAAVVKQRTPEKD